jgi:hypothetical protein
MTEEKKDRPWRNKHHLWCNWFMRKAEGCEMCDKLFAEYPYETEEEAAELYSKHFPEAERTE